MKYPIGIQDFKCIREDGYVYVDKTALVYKLVTEGKVYFLSRPRRFGKSLLVSTLEYYFKGKKELFQGLAIDGLEKEWREYPVFHLDFNSTIFQEGKALKIKLEKYLTVWEDQYGLEHDFNLGLGDRFKFLLESVHRITGKCSVILIDEYDKPLLDVLDTGLKMRDDDGNERLIEDYNREVLKGFYSTFKAADQDLKFVLLTGVTKFSQVSVFSGFNQPMDISMDGSYDALCGITKEELESVFHDEIDAMADELGEDTSEMRKILAKHYDGYHFSSEETDIFNPFSLLNALSRRKVEDYWFRTGTPSYLIRLLARTDENLNELIGKYYDASEFVDYRADVERPLPMLYQSGYLTIKEYDRYSKSYLLDLPNNEVKKGFLTLLATSYLGTRESAGTLVIQLVRALRNDDLATWRKSLEAFFASIPYSMRRKDDERERERYFHYTFYLIFRILSTYVVLTELQQSEGRADCVIETEKCVYIFEFKLDGTAQEALRQIEEKGYARPYVADGRKVRLVGVNFSSKSGTIDDWAEIESLNKVF